MDINKEVLKGHIDLIIISLLHNNDLYGYQIAKLIRETGHHNFDIKEGTLYLSLKRLEKNKFIESYWGADKGPGGRRKYYKITDDGKEKYNHMQVEWIYLKELIDSFLEGRK
ncbi:PadR family transcriptional regulator [Salipaludibacillus keqinensis]|uniref:PadR family transcriptional regulator n=1 Tax=Salipaludibacillus keqinensis TaxID=2045207 RepID=A0A323TGN0_9BACI|nr:PadR family transcriptional regulator [Salipaludibacillus keqinensis]PYZ93426.1 PadR family transcriptional regulator [Salipaludibacillus keqinensis]